MQLPYFELTVLGPLPERPFTGVKSLTIKTVWDLLESQTRAPRDPQMTAVSNFDTRNFKTHFEALFGLTETVLELI